MVKKLRRLSEKKSFVCKKNKSDTLLKSNSYVGSETGIFIIFAFQSHNLVLSPDS